MVFHCFNSNFLRNSPIELKFSGNDLQTVSHSPAKRKFPRYDFRKNMKLFSKNIEMGNFVASLYLIYNFYFQCFFARFFIKIVDMIVSDYC